MDYSKLFRKEMPLAVPTQKRPPGKYASHPYPMLVEDELILSAVMTGEGSQLPAIIDLMQIAAGMQGNGSMRPSLSFYSVDTESMSLTAMLQGDGELLSKREKQQYHTLDTEHLKVAASMSGAGVLRVLLIKHTLKADTMQVSAKIIGSGELT